MLLISARIAKIFRMRYHSNPASFYPSSYYDEQMCLKPPLLLWVAVFYLSRTITLPFAMAVLHFAGVDSAAITYVRAFWSIDALISSLVAAVMLYALIRRVPNAAKHIRWIWAHGRVILAGAAALDIVPLVIALMRRREIDDQSLWSVFAVLIDVFFLLYILAARRVRQAFSEFPLPLGPT